MNDEPSHPNKSRKQSGLVELAIIVVVLGAFFVLRNVLGFG